MSNTTSEVELLVTITLCLVCIGLIIVGLTGIVAAETPDEPDLQCIGSGGGVPYVTDSGTTIYENHTAGIINEFYFPSENGVLFKYEDSAIKFSSGGETSARLEHVTRNSACIGNISTDDPLVIIFGDSLNIDRSEDEADSDEQDLDLNGEDFDRVEREDDGEIIEEEVDLVAIIINGTDVDLALRDPVFDESDDGVDIVYDADELETLALFRADLEDKTVRAFDADSGDELDNATVDNGSVVFSDLPSEGNHSIRLVAEESPGDEDTDDGDNDGDDTNGGGGGGGGGGGSSSDSDDSGDGDDDSDREVTEVTASETDEETEEQDDSDDDVDETDESDDEDEVRSSSVSASISAGSTLSISLGLDDPTDVDEPDADDTDAEDDDTEADDEVDDADDGLEDDEIADDELADDEIEDDELVDDELEDTDDAEDTDEPEVADSDIGERPPPTSQAEVESVEIDVNQDTDADIEIRQSRSPPSEDAREFERADGTQAAGYVQINNNLNPEAVDGGRINYRLNKDDLEADDADPEEVAMYHLNTETDEWEELETEVVGETDEHVRFRAETEGFSEFASGIKRAQFEVDDATVDVQEVTLGDTVRVEAIISNTGGADGTFRTELVVNEEVVEDDILTIASGGTRATLFDHEFLEADTYEVRVNDVSTGEITVLAPESTEPDETESFIPGFGIGAAVVSLLVASLAAWRRQEK